MVLASWCGSRRGGSTYNRDDWWGRGQTYMCNKVTIYNWLCLPGMRGNGKIHVRFLVSHLTHFMLFTLLPTLRFVAGIYTRLPGRPALAELKGHFTFIDLSNYGQIKGQLIKGHCF